VVVPAAGVHRLLIQADGDLTLNTGGAVYSQVLIEIRVNGAPVRSLRKFVANSTANPTLVTDTWSIHELLSVAAGSSQTVQVFASVLSANTAPTIANNLNVGQLTLTLLRVG
jgi:hypothetical protein